MDSVVGSLLMGYWLTIKKGFYKSSLAQEEKVEKFTFPVINFTLKEMDYRLDILHHFQNCGIEHAKIPYFN